MWILNLLILVILFIKKFRALFIPLLSFSLIQFVIDLVYKYSDAIVCITPIGSIKSLIIYIIGSYWFIIILFVSELLSNTAVKLAKSGFKSTNIWVQFITMTVFWIALVMLPRPMIMFSIYLTCLQAMYPFFILGWLCKQINIFEVIRKYHTVACTATLVMLMGCMFWFRKEDFIYFQNFDFWNGIGSILQKIGTVGKIIIGGLVGIVFSYSLIIVLTKYINLKFLAKVGTCALGIYLIQAIVFENICNRYGFRIGNGLLYMILAIGVTALCYGVVLLLRKNNLTSKFMLGKTFK